MPEEKPEAPKKPKAEEKTKAPKKPKVTVYRGRQRFADKIPASKLPKREDKKPA